MLTSFYSTRFALSWVRFCKGFLVISLCMQCPLLFRSLNIKSRAVMIHGHGLHLDVLFYRIEIHRKSSGSTALWKSWRVTSGSCLLWSRSEKYASCFQRYHAFWLPVCGFKCVRERDVVWASRYLEEMYFQGLWIWRLCLTEYFLSSFVFVCLFSQRVGSCDCGLFSGSCGCCCF